MRSFWVLMRLAALNSLILGADSVEVQNLVDAGSEVIMTGSMGHELLHVGLDSWMDEGPSSMISGS